MLLQICYCKSYTQIRRYEFWNSLRLKLSLKKSLRLKICWENTVFTVLCNPPWRWYVQFISQAVVLFFGSRGMSLVFATLPSGTRGGELFYRGPVCLSITRRKGRSGQGGSVSACQRPLPPPSRPSAESPLRTRADRDLNINTLSDRSLSVRPPEGLGWKNQAEVFTDLSPFTQSQRIHRMELIF